MNSDEPRPGPVQVRRKLFFQQSPLYNYLSQCLCVVCVRRERGNSEERIQIRRKLKKIEEEEEEKRKEEGVSLSVAKNVTVR
jgi:hypothetical protein